MKKKNKIIIVSIIVVLFILLVMASIVYAFTDMFKSPKDLFYKYLAQNIESSSKFSYDEMLNNYKDINEKDYISTSEISANVDTQYYDIQDISKQISKLKLKTEQKNISKENKLYKNITLDYDNNNLLEASIIQNNDIYAIKSNILYDKYISVENNNLKQLALKLGIDQDNIPDKFQKINLYELLYISKEDRNQIIKTYKQVLDEALPKDKYTVQRNIETTVNGIDQKANVYLIKISQKEAVDTIIKLLEKLKSDDLTLDLIIEKINMVNINNITKQEEKISKEQLVQTIQDIIEDLQKENTNEEELIIKVYENKGKTIKTEIIVDDIVISLERYENNNEKFIEIKIKQQDTQILNITTQYTIKEENETKILSGKTTIKEEYSDEINFDFEVTTKGKIGTDVNEVNADISFNIEDIKIQMIIKQTLDFNAKVEIEQLNESNSVKINDMSEDEIQNLYTQVYKNAQEEIVKKLQDDEFSQLRELFLNTPHYDLDYNVEM